MRKTSLLFALLALAPLKASLAAQAPASQPVPDWQLLSDDLHISFSWDPASVMRDGDIVRVVKRLTARIISPGPSYADFLTEIRCGDSRMRVVRTSGYGQRGEPIVKNHRKAKFHKIKSAADEKLRAAVCP